MNTGYLKIGHDHLIAIPYLLTNTEALIDVGKEDGIKVNTEETKYILMSCHQNARQNCNTKIANRSMCQSSNILEQQ
jgi:hypothetical protein